MNKKVLIAVPIVLSATLVLAAYVLTLPRSDPTGYTVLSTKPLTFVDNFTVSDVDVTDGPAAKTDHYSITSNTGTNLACTVDLQTVKNSTGSDCTYNESDYTVALNSNTFNIDKFNPKDLTVTTSVAQFACPALVSSTIQVTCTK